jgi:hypothetical protein
MLNRDIDSWVVYVRVISVQSTRKIRYVIRLGFYLIHLVAVAVDPESYGIALVVVVMEKTSKSAHALENLMWKNSYLTKNVKYGL